jgi:hypothetical protein
MTGNDEKNQQTSTALLLFNLAGSVCFTTGSIGFIWSTWTSEWLRPFQYGCTIWILGCILFLLPLLALLKTRCCHLPSELCSCASYCCSRTELCLFGGLMCFLVGCALVAFGTEESVVRYMPPMNALFLAGSALLLVDSLLVVWSHQKFISFHNLACCHDDDDDDDDSANFSCVGLVVASSYVFAGILGGYGGSRGVVRAGMFGWAVGSVVGLLETIPELYQRYISSRGCQCQSKTPTPRNRVSTTRNTPEPSQASAA